MSNASKTWMARRSLRWPGGSPKSARGFTLIELVMTVAIVAILAAIAMPSYLEHIRKARRAQAKADLLEIAQLLERHYTAERSYSTFSLPFSSSPRDGAGGGRYYAIEQVLESSKYTLTATPDGSQANDRCGVLTIDNVGRKYHEKGTDDYCSFGTVGPPAGG